MFFEIILVASKWICTKENITFLIAVVGFVISLYNFFSALRQNRIRLSIDFSHVFRLGRGDKCLDALHVKIINRSYRPVIISRLTLSNPNGVRTFGSFRREVLRIEHRQNGEIYQRDIWMSDILPIKLEGNGYADLLLLSDEIGCFVTLDSENVVSLCTPQKTIRCKPIIRNFCDAKILSECREPNR